jgi:hypothetical protein
MLVDVSVADIMTDDSGTVKGKNQIFPARVLISLFPLSRFRFPIFPTPPHDNSSTDAIINQPLGPSGLGAHG